MNTTGAAASATKKAHFKYTIYESFERNRSIYSVIEAKIGMKDIQPRAHEEVAIFNLAPFEGIEGEYENLMVKAALK